MFAGHFATGLAIKAYRPRVPIWIPLIGVFVPDFLWIAFSRAGIEPTRQAIFFDDWSHSLLMTGVWATLFAFSLWKYGREGVLVAFSSVLSHFVLDMPVHPKFLALYPYSSMHVGIVESHGSFVPGGWWFELSIVVVLCSAYANLAARYGLRRNLIAATIVSVVGLQLLDLG